MKLKQSYDIIVCGGGPAGVCAAISAARKGVSVLLVEKQNSLGGMWTNGMVCPLFDPIQDTPILSELIADLKSADSWGGFIGQSFQFEAMRYVLEEKCRSAGVELLYDTYFSDLQKTENGWQIEVNHIEGKTAYGCKICIDATGDAAVAAKAGAQWQIGVTDYTQCQAMTLMFLIDHIPDGYTEMKNCYQEIKTAYANAGIPEEKIPFQAPYIIRLPNSDLGLVQLTHMYGYDPLDAASRTKAVLEGRRQIMEVYRALKYHHPKFKEIQLITSAPLLGVRESRRIVGEYTLTVEDALNGAQFPDATATCRFNMDVHSADSTAQHCTPIKVFQIPYRSFLPKGVENLLVVGRCISGDHQVMAAYRVTGDCAAMGDCAGNAAANAILQGKSLKEITPAELRS